MGLVLKEGARVQGFQGVDYSTKDRGSGPVQFENDPAEADPFGLDQMLSKVRHFCSGLPTAPWLDFHPLPPMASACQPQFPYLFCTQLSGASLDIYDGAFVSRPCLSVLGDEELLQTEGRNCPHRAALAAVGKPKALALRCCYAWAQSAAMGRIVSGCWIPSLQGVAALQHFKGDKLRGYMRAQVNEGKKRGALDHIGGGGAMRAGGGGGSYEDYAHGSSRSRVEFSRGRG